MSSMDDAFPLDGALPADDFPDLDADALAFAFDEPAEPDDPVTAESFDELADGFRLINTFSEEIENVSTSDWDFDADAMWGGDAPGDFGADPGSTTFDFPV